MEALTLLLLGTLIVCIYTLHKVRRMHREQFRVAENSRASRREVEQIFPQIQAYLDLTRLLDLRQPLPALRGWAASPDFLLEIANHARRSRPETILECSSGASTVVLARCCAISGRGHVYSLEHDTRYAERTRAALKAHNLERWASVIDAPLEAAAEVNGPPWYSLQGLPAALPPADMVVIDGPPGIEGGLARYPALPRLHSRLAETVTIFLDDADRSDERAVLQAWKAEYPDFTVELRQLEKGCAILSRGLASKAAAPVTVRAVEPLRTGDRRRSAAPD
jgi:hypothetical protein